MLCKLGHLSAAERYTYRAAASWWLRTEHGHVGILSTALSSHVRALQCDEEKADAGAL
jgi:hypothetical protein